MPRWRPKRSEKRKEKKKTRRFRKELKMFLRDILLIEPLRLCPTPTLLPFHPSSIRSLSLSFLYILCPTSLSISYSPVQPPTRPLHVYLYTRPSLLLSVILSLSISIRLRISFASTAIYLDRSFIANMKKKEK